MANVQDRFSETPNRSYLGDDVLINIVVSSTNSEDVISSADAVRNYIKSYNKSTKNSKLDILNDTSVTLTERNKLLFRG